MSDAPAQAHGYNVDLAIHTMGWKAFQDLCAQICSEVFNTVVSVYREAQDGGQDAVFITREDGTAKEATVQCKFSSKPHQRLRVGDIESELDTVRELVKTGRASVYYFITSLGVDAPVAATIRDKLIAVGVQEPHVLGREWLTLTIRDSARLRGLVPRVYGLGDLSAILDERCALQTRALLGHMMANLKVYVPTAAHRSAVRILAEHKIVLLLGPPASGKTMLAAILGTTAIDGDKHQCLKCEGPIELTEHWNPHERNRLYWIDDAFGANQLRSDYVDSWISVLPKIKAAMDSGNRFILTSRSHIWNAARPKLGTRNLALFTDGRAIVDVGSHSSEEKAQIVYNHIKAGSQSRDWKERVKPHLESIATNHQLLPEIARRLADRSYTKSVLKFPDDLITFVAEPAEFLQQTILELSEPQQAALTLVFLRRSRLPLSALNNEDMKLVADKYGISSAAIAEALTQLDGAFLSRRNESGMDVIGFIHPTFADAITAILCARHDLVDLYIQGARIETLLAEAICEAAPPVQDAGLIPASADDYLIERVLESPDSKELNRSLFEFLRTRASIPVLQKVLDNSPELLERSTTWSWRIRRDERVRLIALANKIGRVGDQLREEIVGDLERAAKYSFDISFFADEEILSLIPPSRLVALTAQLIERLDTVVIERIDELENEADPQSDLDDQFDDLRSFLNQLEFSIPTVTVQTKLAHLQSEINKAIDRIVERRKDDDDSADWPDITPARVTAVPSGRSIFSDVDE